MKELFFGWIFGLILMAGSGFFVYRSIKDAIKHSKSYNEKKAEKCYSGGIWNGLL